MTAHRLFLPLRGAGHSLKPGLAVAVVAVPVIAGRAFKRGGWMSARA